MYDVSEEMLAEEYRSSIFAKPRDNFCRRWLEDHCDPDDLALMQATRAWFWGPGLVMSETDYLTRGLGRAPSRVEVVALIDRSSRLMSPCFEAWCQSSGYKKLWRSYKDRLLQAHNEMQPGYAKAWMKFRASVLRHGGSEVVPPGSPEPLLGLLLVKGSLVAESTVCVFVRGESLDGHVNAVALWRTGDAIAVGAGYAMSQDMVWRQHSWAWDRDGRLIETTEPPTRYFGVRLDGHDAESFVQRIAPPAVEGNA